ncbi:arsenic resistance protein [Metasolibacillus meyeri]|uniref:Arsenic resistance protein n=1 Tax=Metasolibacillus meyeri TaxID=1071052 RepID=A0AAW9NV71_9BACL|nr:arsenic resistance protein [Metasolibacillus meyeri]MEC1180417.1 arsenic resistance protein [Metasolibacillus meyeri]
MTYYRERLENQQIWIYVFALLLGAILGLVSEHLAAYFAIAISPLIAILMYGMFAQIPFLKLREALSNSKFIVTLLLGNFIAVPLVVWALITLFPQPTPILLGVCLVLLTPCIDYVIVFTQLGKGNEKLMLAATPILFVVQLLLLPLYLWLFIGEEMMGIVHVQPFAEAFLLLIVAPLIVAITTQLWANKNTLGAKVLGSTAWLPVPFMAFVLIAVVASQIGQVYREFDQIIAVLPIYVLFLIITPIVARLIVAFVKLDVGAGRALVFSMGTRNSLVVLPLALALPNEWATIAAAIIVTQTIVELVGELIYIKLVPKWILKDKGESV